MKYICLIYSAESDATANPPAGSPESDQMMAAYFEFTEGVASAGVLVAGEPLQAVDTATTVRVREGQLTTTDGPFAETKEQLGGFYILECDDLDQAIEHAARIPHAATGSIEVRPLMEIPEAP